VFSSVTFASARPSLSIHSQLNACCVSSRIFSPAYLSLTIDFATRRVYLSISAALPPAWHRLNDDINSHHFKQLKTQTSKYKHKHKHTHKQQNMTNDLDDISAANTSDTHALTYKHKLKQQNTNSVPPAWHRLTDDLDDISAANMVDEDYNSHAEQFDEPHLTELEFDFSGSQWLTVLVPNVRRFLGYFLLRLFPYPDVAHAAAAPALVLRLLSFLRTCNALPASSPAFAEAFSIATTAQSQLPRCVRLTEALPGATNFVVRRASALVTFICVLFCVAP
jgi:hypothetical protein